ncbi:hypothetical protein [Romboutsia ilealis]|uniref:hypothetical protein n=1 Tax=Romboutsia ilealis TaxID=1115758 RepID=UPI0025707DFC|nr:hypothetical protein [Romboutsia ilealis]
MARIQVSFKNNDTELKLYDEVMKAYDKSAFVKECIQFYLDNKNKNVTYDKADPQVTNDIDNIDWEF